MEKGQVTRGWLGVAMNPVDADVAEAFGFASEGGILVAEVTKDSPAGKAGLKRGDAILAYGGKPVKDHWTLRDFVASTVPCAEVELWPRGVSGAIRQAAGRQPFRELRRHGPSPLGGAALTTGMLAA